MKIQRGVIQRCNVARNRNTSTGEKGLSSTIQPEFVHRNELIYRRRVQVNLTNSLSAATTSRIGSCPNPMSKEVAIMLACRDFRLHRSHSLRQIA